MDVPGVECIRLRHDWPGWWSKLEVFTLPGPVLFMDLDTIIVGPLDDLLTGHRFTMLEDFYSPGRIASGVMAWGPASGLSEIYAAFYRQQDRAMTVFRGDQDFIAAHLPYQPETWQAKHPGRVVSFKAHCRPAGRIPAGASIVAFHGPPRPWAMTESERAMFGEAA